MTVTLYSRKPVSAYALGSEALVGYLGLDVKIEYLSNEKPNEQYSKLFAANNHFTPSLYDSDKKLAINQAVAVNRYLLSLAKDTKGLEGKEPSHQYEILQWSSRVSGDIFDKIKPAIVAKFTGKTLNQKQVDEIIEQASRGLDILEAHLKANTYLVGETLTLAEFESAGLLYVVFVFFFNSKWQKKYPAITRWANTVLNSKAFKTRLDGKFTFAKEGSLEQFYAKEEKKAAKPSESSSGSSEKKPGHPLAQLGSSSIPIDELKRTYSNKETREEALPWFWNTFYNDEEWSIWKVDYKYNDELTLTFMSNNLIGGFFNRLSGSIKYIFGAAVVYGENNNNGIRGAFVVRGKEFLPAFEVAPDWESFEFTRLDASNAADRAELEDLWAWDKPLDVNGEKREIADGKVLK